LIVGSSQSLPGPNFDITVVRIIGTAPACTSDADCDVCERCGSGGTCEIGARSGCAVAATNAAKLLVRSRGFGSNGLALLWKGAVPARDTTTTDNIRVWLSQ